MAATKQKRCLSCKKRPPWSRGNCRKCREIRRGQIASGEFAEDELVAAGLLLPRSNRGRPRNKESERLREEAKSKIDRIRKEKERVKEIELRGSARHLSASPA